MMNLLDFARVCTDIQAMQVLDTDSLRQIPCYFYMKDKGGKYIGVNHFLIKDTGHTSENDLLGISDYDLCKNPTAIHLTHNDHLVMKSEQPTTFVEPITFLNERNITSISYKSPLRSREGDVLGVIGLSIVHYQDTVSSQLKKINYLMTHQDRPLTINGALLSEREQDVLRLLLMGKTAKEMATDLMISPRTIEHHIENIKNKTGASTKSELIAMLCKEINK
jgi:DNA-binding CsgD family transcriptional regulator